MTTKLDTFIHSLLLENTGSHFLDSGGAYGRNWQRNQGKTVQDYISAPSAVLEVSKWERDGVEKWDCSPTLSLFHHLRDNLELDHICDEFNSLTVNDWDSEFYGVSVEGFHWLRDQGFLPNGDGFNSYNWCANFTQVVQGQKLKLEGEHYLLLQIHGGCDVRGGYTDAKLFKFSNDEMYFLYESAGFGVDDGSEYLSLSWSGEWIDSDGGCADDEYLERFCRLLGEGTHTGDQYATC